MKTYKKLFVPLLFLLFHNASYAQLKYLIEDFEGLAEYQENMKKEGIFSYGSIRPEINSEATEGNGYSGKRCIKLEWNKKELQYGGWGKGISAFVELNPSEDFFNFYFLSPEMNGKKDHLKISIEEDDNNNNRFESDKDDVWSTTIDLETSNSWRLISLPLKDFKDNNKGGDGIFNANHKEGRIFSIILSFIDVHKQGDNGSWMFDFLCFSRGVLPTGEAIFSPPKAVQNGFCVLGAWSDEGNNGDLWKIPTAIESMLSSSNNKLGVVHFFKPFFLSSGTTHKNYYPNVEKINVLIHSGYTPMLTLEYKIGGASPGVKQPNLYSIIEGHFDQSMIEWAQRLRNVEGKVLLRILHEFNGNWYPWCIVNNNRNPELFVKAFRHIRQIFWEQGAGNVKFVWCPNSKSHPQESWNSILEAYPGNEYVDYVGMDVYNGAGDDNFSIWRSFRKEAIENYFLFTNYYADKPILICETSSRERQDWEKGNLQNKADWIAQMSEALKTDLSGIRMLSWFNQYDKFKINSSDAARTAFLNYHWEDPYFKNNQYLLFNKRESNK